MLLRERLIVMIGGTPSTRYTREVAIPGLQLCREILRLDGTNYIREARELALRKFPEGGRAIWRGGGVLGQGALGGQGISGCPVSPQ